MIIATLGAASKYQMDAAANGFMGPVYVTRLKMFKGSVTSSNTPQTPKATGASKPSGAMTSTAKAVQPPEIVPVTDQVIPLRDEKPQVGPGFFT
ncbi:hypothetical protein LX64_02578 [Chitinophaga skermanii]|uniref:Uncharacterized protein n=2 Tax=Chitinophaga skermanii TaxID=331697 RepID=A0A327QM59_9BACT|nr:hypothetical protein LX64_02578 [Chitinophaga skermanii]